MGLDELIEDHLSPLGLGREQPHQQRELEVEIKRDEGPVVGEISRADEI